MMQAENKPRRIASHKPPSRFKSRSGQKTISVSMPTNGRLQKDQEEQWPIPPLVLN